MPRVRRAMWRMAYAPRMRWADMVLPILVGGMEAPLKIGRRDLTQQFKKRASALAADVGTSAEEVPQSSDEQSALAEVVLLQDVLRSGVRRAIEDAEFRQVFGPGNGAFSFARTRR